MQMSARLFCVACGLQTGGKHSARSTRFLPLVDCTDTGEHAGAPAHSAASRNQQRERPVAGLRLCRPRRLDRANEAAGQRTNRGGLARLFEAASPCCGRVREQRVGGAGARRMETTTRHGEQTAMGRPILGGMGSAQQREN